MAEEGIISLVTLFVREKNVSHIHLPRFFPEVPLSELHHITHALSQCSPTSFMFQIECFFNTKGYLDEGYLDEGYLDGIISELQKLNFTWMFWGLRYQYLITSITHSRHTSVCWHIDIEHSALGYMGDRENMYPYINFSERRGLPVRRKKDMVVKGVSSILILINT